METASHAMTHGSSALLRPSLCNGALPPPFEDHPFHEREAKGLDTRSQSRSQGFAGDAPHGRSGPFHLATYAGPMPHCPPSPEVRKKDAGGRPLLSSRHIKIPERTSARGVLLRTYRNVHLVPPRGRKGQLFEYSARSDRRHCTPEEICQEVPRRFAAAKVMDQNEQEGRCCTSSSQLVELPSQLVELPLPAVSSAGRR